jgi:hypothetical protein
MKKACGRRLSCYRNRCPEMETDMGTYPVFEAMFRQVTINFADFNRTLSGPAWIVKLPGSTTRFMSTL